MTGKYRHRVTKRKILIIFAHPALEKSRVNKTLIETLENVEGVTLHDLYEYYPEMDIDVPAERQLLLEHDVILFQYPFLLFGPPALVKEWMDLVLVHGWAFGRNGNALQGKWTSHVITTGGSEGSYTKEGFNRFTMRELLAPHEQAAHLCGMRYLAPYVIHGTNVMTSDMIEEEAQQYRHTLVALVDQTLDPKKLENQDNLRDQFRNI